MGTPKFFDKNWLRWTALKELNPCETRFGLLTTSLVPAGNKRGGKVLLL
jgi:hypothetical protein